MWAGLAVSDPPSWRLRPVSMSGRALIGTWPMTQMRGLRVAASLSQSNAASGISLLMTESVFPL